MESENEIDIKRMKRDIQSAAAAQPSRPDPSLSYALYRRISRDNPHLATPLRLKRERPLPAGDNGHYKLRDLLQFYDQEFVRQCYHAVLKREPDPAGFQQHLKSLRSGQMDRIDVLKSLRFSAEGREKAARVHGLFAVAVARKIKRTFPILASPFEWLIDVARLPRLKRELRSLETTATSQQQEICDYINRLNGRITDLYLRLALLSGNTGDAKDSSAEMDGGPASGPAAG